MARMDDEGRKKRSDELYRWLLELQQGGRELALDTAEALWEVNDGGYFADYGYDSFVALAKSIFRLEKTQAYLYLQLHENVMKGLPEWAAESLVRSAENSRNPLPLKILAALHFNRVDPKELERVRALEPDAQRAELLRLGYDRDRMGGRSASDLMRPYVSRRTGRDQSREMGLLREKLRCARGEKAEEEEENRKLREKIEQILEAIKDPQAAKVVKQIELLSGRLAELEKDRAADEAEIAVGKEVGTRALILSGEIQALLGRFEDSVRIDNSKQWTEVWRIIDSIQDAVRDCRGRMAGVILARIEDGEITRFAVEEPGEEVRTAEQAMRPRAK